MYRKSGDASAICGADECKLEEAGVDIFARMLESDLKNAHIFKYLAYDAARNALKMCNSGVEPDQYLDELGDVIFNWIREYLSTEVMKSVEGG